MNDFIVDDIGALLGDTVSISEDDIRKNLELPKVREHGDFAFPTFFLARIMRMAPPKIAQEIYSRIADKLPFGCIESAEAAGGYINFKVSPQILSQKLLAEIYSEGEGYGFTNEGDGRNLTIDLSSPNIAKPFHVGHLRSTVVGSCLYRLFEKLGYNCIGINHLGDWGTQFGKLIVAYKKFGTEKLFEKEPIYALLDLYIRFHKEAAADPSLEDQAREEFKKLEQGDPEATEIWKRFYEYSLEEYKRIYSILNATIDEYTGESFYNDKMDDALELLERKGLTEISRDALIVNLEEYGLGAALLKKSDEATLYLTRDLAAILYRKNTYDFAKMLYVVGSAQALHFKQLFKIIELLGYEWHTDCHHIEFGWIKFGKEMMSTREGNIVFLNDVINRARELAKEIILEKNPDIEDAERAALHIGVGAVIYADLAVRRNHDINFSWEDALNFDGNTGPYLQYTHARLASLERKFEKEVTADIDFALLKEPEEKQLMLTLYRFPQKLKQAAEDYEPAVICGYLYELSQNLNSFYQKHRVITEDTALTNARMLLMRCVRTVMKEGLKILGLEPMERM
ncbi:MAG TPA: arginine--tRNA ligase [candidate division Zixibacteria bacterium]|nr:arginine--tRNA ligase [candidate division Zixibacteria bacterium]